MSDDEFTKRRMRVIALELLDARKIAAREIGLPYEIANLLDMLSLVLAEDKLDCGVNDFMECRRGCLSNIDSFLHAYDEATQKFPKLLTDRCDK